MTGYWTQSRPYIEGQRFTGAGKYWRPNLGAHWWYWAPEEVKAAILWSIAATATTLLAGIRVWQAITKTTDETGD